MEYRLLGPLQVCMSGGVDVTPSARKPRELLALLLINAGQVVAADTLVDQLWSNSPPPAAANALQVYVSQLRRTVFGGCARPPLATRGAGYRLDVDEDELDVRRFDAHVRQGRALLDSEEYAAAGQRLRDGLSLWRGPALTGAEAEALISHARALDSHRLDVVEDRIAADLGSGRDAELVTELEELIARHPLRERLWAQLVTALYRCDRQGEAVAAYARARALLQSELGVEPGPALQDLYQDVLRQAPRLQRPPRASDAKVAVARPETATPRAAAERRLVSVLLADLGEATGDGTAPAGFEEAVRAHGGQMTAMVGSVAVAVFGATTIVGDEPERAVRCAAALTAPVAAVVTGEVSVTGAATDILASAPVERGLRLIGAERPGLIRIDSATREAARHALEVEPLDPLPRANGVPLPLWAMTSLVPPAAALQRRYSSPYVGREREHACALALWERVVAERQPHLVTVIGSPGAGKSRFAHELIQAISADHAPAHALRGRAVPFRGGATSGPFGEIVRAAAGIFSDDDVDTAAHKLRASVDSLSTETTTDEADELVAHLARLVGLPSSRDVADRQPLFAAARQFIAALAADAPLLLVVEDAQWADAAVLDLLEYLIGRLREVAVLVVVLARPELLEQRSNWAGGLPATLLSLDRLPDADSRMLAELLGATGNDVDQIVGACDGNPLFIEELVAATRHGGADVPTTIRSAIEARLDALPPRAKALAMDAAVVGRIFWRPAAAPRTAQADVEDRLDILERHDIIRRDPVSDFSGQPQWSFRHALIREVAYAMLDQAARVRRHREVAEFLEEMAGDRLAEFAGELGHHWAAAGEHPRAGDRFLVAARHAVAGWSKSEAVQFFARAFELVDDPGQRRRIRLERAGALLDNGEYSTARDEYDALLPDLTGQQRLLALRGRMKAAWWLEAADEVRRDVAEAVQVATDLHDPALAAPALALLSHVAGMEGRPVEMVESGERALAQWREGTQPADLAYHLEILGLAHSWVGRYSQAVERARQGYALAATCHSVEAMVRSGATLGLALAGLGAHEEALRVFDDVLQRGRDLEVVPRFTGRALNMCSLVHREVFDLVAARRCNEEAIELGRRSGFSLVWIQAGIDLAFTDLLSGDLDRVSARLPELRTETEQTRGFHQWLMTGRLLVAQAELDVARERPGEAVTSARAALEHARGTGRVKHEVAARRVLGRALIGTGRPDEGVVELTRAVSLATALNHPPTTWLTLAVSADGFAAAGRCDDAGDARMAAQACATGFANGLSAQRRERFLAFPVVARLMSDADDEPVRDDPGTSRPARTGKT